MSSNTAQRNPFLIFHGDCLDDADRLFNDDNHQFKTGIIVDLESNIHDKSVVQNYQAATKGKDFAVANADTGKLASSEGRVIQLSPSIQESFSSEEVGHSETFGTPSSMQVEPAAFSQVTPDIFPIVSSQLKGKKQAKTKQAGKEKKEKKEVKPKIPKMPKSPKMASNLKKRKSSETQNESQPQKTKKIEKKKKDQRKNMYGYSFKFILKAFLSNDYKAFFQKLCAEEGVDGDRVREFYSPKLAWSISLKDLRSLLNFKEEGLSSQLGRVKKCFHSFYVWFMRKRYTLHILTEKKIVHKAPYLQAKNYLVYLPDIRPKERAEEEEMEEEPIHDFSSIDEE